MRIWRLCRREHAVDPLSGRGGLYAAGRWHPRGRRIVYASSTRSLAALEVLVHVDKDLIPADLVSLEIEIPEGLEIERIDGRTLPSDWRAYLAPAALQKLGVEWLDRGESAVLEVPSAVIPQESNYLLNPAHETARKIRVVRTEEFVLDPRLLG
jgi:RES domain-containing protein